MAEGQTIIEMLEKHRTGVRYACVLLTPDDEGYKSGCPGEKKPRARQNVVLELGMFLSTLGRKHVAILHKGDVEYSSDIHGLFTFRSRTMSGEVKQRLAAELQECGFHIEASKYVGRVKKVIIYSDGSCHGNPGPGGWAATLSSRSPLPRD